MGGSSPQVPTVDPDPGWLKQEEYQAGAYETQQSMNTAQMDTANFMSRYGTRRNVAQGTQTSVTSVLYPTVGSMNPGGLADPAVGGSLANPLPNPLSVTTAPAPGSVGVTGR
jgi:hypothetical protein